ncbi:hypothetical protein ILUMI_22768 [Ignelater luminosus]|uniref:RNA-directed DNA polymerase n=1 Tax=Ignelater luminosus TaxID=2038154 RepID=A0A8K0CGH2_IGNLU|nr:hypothetical protein ILUMI_22768 [Ignelater luminosus]
MPDGTERMVACVSRTVKKAELNYSTVYRKALACIFAVKKFADYVFGQKFTIRTNQRALIAMLELQAISNCLFWGHKVAITFKLQKQIMQDLHSTHQGIVRSKALAKSYFWFVGIDKEIKQMCKAYVPFGTVHRDHCDFGSTHLLVIIDSCTKWLEVYQTPSITTKCTIGSLRDCFARFGLPYTVVSDDATGYQRHDHRASKVDDISNVIVSDDGNDAAVVRPRRAMRRPDKPNCGVFSFTVHKYNTLKQRNCLFSINIQEAKNNK